MILKIEADVIENIIENMHKLGENILYMLSFHKVVKEYVDKAME